MKRIKIAILSLFTLTLLSIAASGQCVNEVCPDGSCVTQFTPIQVQRIAPQENQQGPPGYLAKISVEHGSFRDKGTGSLILKNTTEGLLITNAHLFERGREVTEIVVTLPEGVFRGVLVALDRVWDLAAIVIPRPQAKALPIAGEYVRAGERVWLAGYGINGRSYRSVSGEARGYASPSPGEAEIQLVVGTPSRSGDSGGPMLNSQGHLVGVLWGTTATTTRGTSVPKLQECVERFLVPWNAQAATEEARREAEREQALIGLIQQNQPATDQTLTTRINGIEKRLETITVQLETLVTSPELEEAPPFLQKTPPAALAVQEPSGIVEEPPKEAPVSGIVWGPLYTWIASLGVVGVAIMGLLRFTGLGKLGQVKTRETARTGANLVETLLMGFASRTKTELDDWAVQAGRKKIKSVFDLLFGKLAEEVVKKSNQQNNVAGT